MFKHLKKYPVHFKDKNFLLSLLAALVLLAVSLIANFYAGVYATEQASNAVTDLILSNVPVFDLDGAIVYGTLIFWAFVVLICLLYPQKISFTLKSIALFILIRSAFISLTHIGPFPSHINLDSSLINKFTFSGDLFFSGHTGFPFLMSLLFWKNKFLRCLFIAASVFFGTVMLLSHMHYSIDVLGAFFITYTIYHLSEKLFKKDKQLFESAD